MDNSEFREQAHRLVDWMADYFEQVEDYPVYPSDILPGDTRSQLPHSAPKEGETFQTIFEDFQKIIMPGITHWESPNFMGYFPANKSYPSVLAEMLTATLGAQCMSWITSPAATELEEQVMEWLRQAIGLPKAFTGVIEDTASTSTLCALLMARERSSRFSINESGFSEAESYTLYCSEETHSSIEKNAKIAGFGRSNLRTISTDEDFALDIKLLRRQIEEDIQQGHTPAAVIATLGTTGSTAIDPLNEIASLCKEYNLYLHVDAAYAGTALLLPDMRWMIEGIEQVDSFVFNPHKWMFTNFDCSAFFVRDEALLVRTFEITPEYLKSSKDQRVRNYRDWGIQLGRRFRALKLWFVLRTFGIKGLQEKIRYHLSLAQEIKHKIQHHSDFELLAPVPLNTLCFRYHPESIDEEEKLNEINQRLLEKIQHSGQLFLTHTKLRDKYTIRMVIGNTNVEKRHIQQAWDLVTQLATNIY